MAFFCAVDPKPEIPCGNELARDEAITFNIYADCYTAIASKLAPTMISVGFSL